MYDKVQPVGVNIDKLTILADLEADHDVFYDKIMKLGFEMQDYQSSKYGYSYVFIHKEFGGYIEMARQKIDHDVEELERQANQLWGKLKLIAMGEPNNTGLTKEELNEKLSGIKEQLAQVDERGHLKRLKDVRYELNPKYFKYIDDLRDTYDEIISMLDFPTMSISSIHLAFDYNVPLTKLDIVDFASRKEVRYLNQQKEVETIYLASRSSRNQICIYDKKRENEENKSVDQYPDLDVITRFESRLKGEYAKKFAESNYNPFSGIKVSDDLDQAILMVDDITTTERAKLLMYVNYPHTLKGESESTRRRYNKKIESLETTTLDIVKDFEDKKSPLVAELEDLLKPYYYHLWFKDSIAEMELVGQ